MRAEDLEGVICSCGGKRAKKARRLDAPQHPESMHEGKGQGTIRPFEENDHQGHKGGFFIARRFSHGWVHEAAKVIFERGECEGNAPQQVPLVTPEAWQVWAKGKHRDRCK